MLFAVFMTYVLSQLVTRRVFRYVHLPLEGELHIYFEETIETTGHLMMNVASPSSTVGEKKSFF